MGWDGGAEGHGRGVVSGVWCGQWVWSLGCCHWDVGIGMLIGGGQWGVVIGVGPKG